MFEKKDIALFIVAFSLVSAIVFVGWGAIKGLVFNPEIAMTPEQYGAIFTFVFGILLGSAITYLGIRAGQANGNSIGQG